MCSNASTNEGPVLFLSGTTQAYLLNTSMQVNKYTKPSLSFFQISDIYQVRLKLVIDPSHNDSTTYKVPVAQVCEVCKGPDDSTTIVLEDV